MCFHFSLPVLSHFFFTRIFTSPLCLTAHFFNVKSSNNSVWLLFCEHTHILASLQCKRCLYVVDMLCSSQYSNLFYNFTFIFTALALKKTHSMILHIELSVLYTTYIKAKISCSLSLKKTLLTLLNLSGGYGVTRWRIT